MSRIKHHCNLGLDHDEFNLSVKRSFRRLFIPDPDCALTHHVLRSQFMIRTERYRHFTEHPWTISPLSIFRQIWEMIMITCFLLFFILQPVHVAFVYGVNETDSFRVWLHPIELGLDIIFFMDIGMNLFTGFRAPKTDEIELSLKKIQLKYLKFYFWIDFVSSIPFFIIIPLEESETQTAFECIRDQAYSASCLSDILDFLKMLKLLRFLTFLRYISNLFKQMQWRNFHFRICRLIFTSLIVFHGCNCLNFLIARLMRGAEAVGEGTNALDMYLHAMYDTFPIIVLFGYHLPSADDKTDFTSLIATILLTLVGLLLRAYLIAHTFMLTQIIYSSSMKFQKDRYQLKEYMRYKQLPQSIQRRLLNYHDHSLSKKFTKEQNTKMDDTIGKKLVDEMVYHRKRIILKQVTFIRLFPDEVIRKIAAALTMETYMNGDVVPHIIIGSGLHFIVSGSLAAYDSYNVEQFHYEDGDIFGSLYDNNDDEINEVKISKIISVGNTETYYLSSNDYKDIVQLDYTMYYERARRLGPASELINEIFNELLDTVAVRCRDPKVSLF